MIEIDEIDMKILEMLEQDSKTTFSQMAKALNLSEAGIRKRVLALQDKKIIKKFTIEIDLTKIGFNCRALLGVDVESQKLLEAVEKLCALPEVRKLSTAIGDHMIVMEIWTEDGRELTKLIAEKIQPIAGIKRICPAIVQEKYKG